MNKEKFGAFIAEARKEKGMTQQKLADQLHVTDKAISKWERGLCFPDLTLMEDLAAALGLTLTELMTCQRHTEDANGGAAVHSLLDISGNILQAQRRTIWIRAIITLILLLVLAASILYASTNISGFRRGTVFMKQAVGADYFIYIEDKDRLIRLQCLDQETYASIEADNVSEYNIQYSWNRLTYKGIVESCIPQEDQIVLGGIMDQVGASIDFGSVLGIDCVWQEFQNIYPDPDRESGFLFTYRLWYFGDGSDYFATGEEMPLVTATNCRSLCAEDYDEDGIVELFVLTRYDEEPYILYDLENEKIVRQFLTKIPDSVEEVFQQDIERYRGV